MGPAEEPGAGAGTGKERGAVLTFAAGGTRYRVNVGDVEGIDLIEAGAVPVPGAPPFLRGIANRRGYLLPIVDLPVALAWTRTRATLREGERAAPVRRVGWVVILRHGDVMAGVLSEVQPDLMDEAPPETVALDVGAVLAELVRDRG